MFLNIEVFDDVYEFDLKLLPQVRIDIAFSECCFTIEVVIKHS